MSAVWQASRGAVRRRRLQTFVIGLVVMCSTAAVLFALGVLDAASSPFDRAFARQHGAQVVASFDRGRATDAQLATTAARPGVQAVAGPFPEAVLRFPKDFLWLPPGTLTVVGRADHGGAVDQLTLRAGRWATAPGEVVVNTPGRYGPSDMLGTVLQAEGAPPLKVVGFATSISQSAGAWVTPAQAAALHPTVSQVLYRFRAGDTQAELRAAMARATAGLPAGALQGSQSWLTVRQSYAATADSYLPLITLFGVLSLIVSVLITANVVSGAVVSGFRHIGVLKAIGFSPNQVVAVYLAMVSVPALAGAVLGTALGTALTGPALGVVFQGIETNGVEPHVGLWVPGVSLLGMPLLVALAALVPALRSHRLSAARAISAGSAARGGRGLRIQRGLAGTRLPRPVSLGLGQPFARPGRALMTLAALVLGVATVTVTLGLSSTMLAYEAPVHAGPTVDVLTGSAEVHQTLPKLGDAQDEALMRSLPGVEGVAANAAVRVNILGYPQTSTAFFFRGDPPNAARRLAAGHWLTGPDEVVAGPMFLRQHGLAVGDRMTLTTSQGTARVTVVGETVDGDVRGLNVSWSALARLAPDARANAFSVFLARGTDTAAWVAELKAGDPGLYTQVSSASSAAANAVIGFSTVFTVLLSVVAALGVFNTVLLNVRERRRDLGMLKSVGMTPRQVVVMCVTSVAALGAVSGVVGIPLGMLAHRLVVDHVLVVTFTESMKDVWHVPQLVGLALAGVVIAVLGALLPSRSAARLPIATVLHNE